MASRYPSTVDGFGIPPDEGTTLAEGLAGAGYRCGFFSDNQFTGSEYNFDRGYDTGGGYEKSLTERVRDRLDSDDVLYRSLETVYRPIKRAEKALSTLGNTTNGEKIRSNEKDAATLNAEAREWLAGSDRGDGPVHLWIHYMDPHRYEPPPGYLPDVDFPMDPADVEPSKNADVLTEAEAETLELLYDGACRYLDDRVGEFLDHLRSAGWLSESDVLVLTSDHGEILDEWQQWGERGHGNYFCEECTHIPFVVSAPDLPTTTVERQASLVDMVPTLFDLGDVDGHDDVMGESLVPVVRDETTRDVVFYDGQDDFHGARCQERETKRFNTESVGPDVFIDTTFDADGERIVEESNPELKRYIRRRGRELRRARTGTGVAADSDRVQQHLEDLGYK